MEACFHRKRRREPSAHLRECHFLRMVRFNDGSPVASNEAYGGSGARARGGSNINPNASRSVMFFIGSRVAIKFRTGCSLRGRRFFQNP